MGADRRAIRDYYDVIDAADCPMCGQDSALMAPACTEGHGEDCPERLCVDCGTAFVLVTGALVDEPVVTSDRTA